MATPYAAATSPPLKGGPSFTLNNRIYRAAWGITWIALASWTPNQFAPWRRFLLRLFGAKVAAFCDVRGSAKVWSPANLIIEDGAILANHVNCYNMATITVMQGVIVSQGAHLCCGNHDINDPNFQLVAKPITLERKSWIAAEAFVAPGVTVGEGAVLGARAVALSDLEPWSLYVGNPAQKRRSRKLG